MDCGKRPYICASVPSRKLTKFQRLVLLQAHRLCCFSKSNQTERHVILDFELCKIVFTALQLVQGAAVKHHDRYPLLNGALYLFWIT